MYCKTYHNVIKDWAVTLPAHVGIYTPNMNYVFCYILKRPWIAIHCLCLFYFFIQVSFLAKDRKYPPTTETKIERSHISKIDFPVIFKICIEPGLDGPNLYSTGYENIFNYFAGISRFNGSIKGGAGHTESG